MLKYLKMSLEHLSHLSYEELVRAFATPFLEDGRENWDLPHTKVVRYHAWQLSSHIAGKPGVQWSFDSLRKVLITTAWLHDAGYQAARHTSMDTMKGDKPRHMRRGALLSSVFFRRASGLYTPQEAQKITHIVATHDSPEKIEDLVDTAFFEADTLGSLDITGLGIHGTKPTFSGEAGLARLERLIEPGGRLEHFRTDYGKQKFQELWSESYRYFMEKARLEQS